MRSFTELANSVRNQTQLTDNSFHTWYQFVLGYPPHLVRYYLNKFGVQPKNLVLDPFCGTGTTNVECKKLNIHSLGLEANPVTSFSSRVKTNWLVSPLEVREALNSVIGCASRSLERFGLAEDASIFFQPSTGNSLVAEPNLTKDQVDVLPKDFISPTPLRRVLILKGCIEGLENEPVRNILLLALANLAVNHAGNIAFGPEVYTRRPKRDIHILDFFCRLVDRVICDLESQPAASGDAKILHGDARRVFEFFSSWRDQVNFVITSPPYPNEKDYTRTTRLESVILGLISSKKELRLLKEQLLRSNSRNVFVTDDDENFVQSFNSIARLARQIEENVLVLGK